MVRILISKKKNTIISAFQVVVSASYKINKNNTVITVFQVVAAAREAKLKGVGVELNPWLVWYSRWAAWRGGVASSTSFVTQDLWRLDLNGFKNIVVFGVEEMVSVGWVGVFGVVWCVCVFVFSITYGVCVWCNAYEPREV